MNAETGLLAGFLMPSDQVVRGDTGRKCLIVSHAGKIVHHRGEYPIAGRSKEYQKPRR